MKQQYHIPEFELCYFSLSDIISASVEPQGEDFINVNEFDI